MTSTFEETTLMFQRIYDNEKRNIFSLIPVSSTLTAGILHHYLICLALRILDLRNVSVSTSFFLFCNNKETD